MMRSRVVLPEPDGPSSATSSPAGMSRLMLSQTTVRPKRLLRLRTSMLMPVSFDVDSWGWPEGSFRMVFLQPQLRLDPLLDDELEHQAHQRQAGQQRGDREGRRELIFVVEDLDVQRHRVGLAAHVAGHHADG